MKRFAALLVLCAILISSCVAVSAEGVYVRSESGDIVRIMENTEISEPVRGNAVVVLGDATVNSEVEGHVITVFGDVTVNAAVSGQVVSLFGNTVLGDNARITGDVITIGSLVKSDGAVIGGQEVRILGESMNLDIGAFFYLRLIITMLFTLAALIIGMLALLISRRKYTGIAKRLERDFGRKLILGILAFTGATALLMILLLTLIAPLLYIIIMLLASIPAFMYLGRKILKTFSSKNSIFAEFITGLMTVTLVKLIILFMVPQQSVLVSAIIIGVISVFIYSLGMGILVEQYYLKNSGASGKPGRGSGTPGKQDVRPEAEGPKPENRKTE
jgi:hypothetical protein